MKLYHGSTVPVEKPEIRRGDAAASPARLAVLKDYCRQKLLAIPGVVEVARGSAPHPHIKHLKTIIDDFTGA